MRGYLLELVEQVLRRGTADVMDLVNLVYFVVSREKREERKDLEEYTADSPNIHLMVIVPVCQQALR